MPVSRFCAGERQACRPDIGHSPWCMRGTGVPEGERISASSASPPSGSPPSPAARASRVSMRLNTRPGASSGSSSSWCRCLWHQRVRRQCSTGGKSHGLWAYPCQCQPLHARDYSVQAMQCKMAHPQMHATTQSCLSGLCFTAICGAQAVKNHGAGSRCSVFHESVILRHMTTAFRQRKMEHQHTQMHATLPSCVSRLRSTAICGAQAVELYGAGSRCSVIRGLVMLTHMTTAFRQCKVEHQHTQMHATCKVEHQHTQMHATSPSCVSGLRSTASCGAQAVELYGAGSRCSIIHGSVMLDGSLRQLLPQHQSHRTWRGCRACASAPGAQITVGQHPDKWEGAGL